MPVVTDIKRQKGRDTRFNVQVDGVYAFALSDLELSSSGLRVGCTLTVDEVAHYQEQAKRSKAYAWAVRFLSIRPRSRREVEEYLLRKGGKEAEIEEAVRRLERVGLLDDQAFARIWIANRQALRPRSRRVLERELAAKGVTRADAEPALGEIDAEDEVQSLMTMIERKKRLPQYAAPEKLMAYLARQGYPYELIKRAMERLEK